MSYAEEYRNIVKAGRRESKDLGEKAQNAVIDTFALMDKADAEIARLNALLAEAREGLETAAQALHDHVAIEGDQASTAVKVARAILAKLGA